MAAGEKVAAHVLELLREGPASQRELGRATGVTQPTVHRALRLLVRAGLVVRGPLRRLGTVPGQPPATYSLTAAGEAVPVGEPPDLTIGEIPDPPQGKP